MQMRNARVRNAKLSMSLGLDMESSRGSLSKELFLFLFEPRTSSMKLTKILDGMVSSSINFVDLEPSLSGFEVHRVTGRFKSTMIRKTEYWGLVGYFWQWRD